MRRVLAPERWPLDPARLPADALLVGGAVRDALLGRLGERPDLDLVVAGDAVALAHDLARRYGGSCVVLDAERSIARLVLRGWSFDLARRMGDSLAQDLGRRDYSVNAIALPLASLRPADGDTDLVGPIDPGGGLADLRAQRLRALGEANLLEDPLRLLRGVRLACELGFTIDAQTRGWIQTHHRRLGAVAGERVLAELERLAAAPEGADGLRQVLALGLLRGWSAESTDGEAEHDQRQQEARAFRRLERLTRQSARRSGLRADEESWALPVARLAAVLEPAALQRLRASRRLQQRCRRLGHWLHHLEERAVARGPACAAVADAGRGALTLEGLAEAERLTLQQELEEDLPALIPQLAPAEAHRALGRWRDPADPLFHPRAPLDGRRLQQLLDLPPGRTLGALLDHLTRERAFGRLAPAGDPEPVLQEARRWLSERSRSMTEPSAGGQAP